MADREALNAQLLDVADRDISRAELEAQLLDVADRRKSRAELEAELRALAAKLTAREKSREKSNAYRSVAQFAGALVDIPLGIAKVAGELERYTPPGLIARAAGYPTPLEATREFLNVPSTQEIRKKIPFISQHDPQIGGERMGEIAGYAAGLAMPMGAFAATVGKAPAIAGRVRTFAQNIVSDIGQTYKAGKKRFIAKETGLGFTAAVGGLAAQQEFPDTLGARFAGEILGGMAPSLAYKAGVSTAKTLGNMSLYLPTVRWLVKHGKNIGRQVIEATSIKGTAKRVKQRFERAGLDPVVAKAGLKEDVLAGLTPAQQSNVPSLLSLEKAVINSSEKLTLQADNQISSMNELIRNSLKEIQPGSPLKTEETFSIMQQHLEKLLDTRVGIAAQKTNERLSRLAPQSSPETVNRIATKEIDAAFAAGKVQENELYSFVNEAAQVPTDSARSTLSQLIKETGKPQQRDIPAYVKGYLLNNKKQGGLGTITTVLDLRALQSRLRETARIARKENHMNKARISDAIGNAIIDDLARTEGGGEAVRLAVSFSKHMKERFSRGSIGQLRGFAKEGGRITPEGLSLDFLIGRTAGKARQGYDEIIKAFDSPEAPDPVGVKTAVNDWVMNRFFRSPAIENGNINPNKARMFLHRNEELLNRLPEVTKEIKEAIDLGDITALRERQMSRVKFDDPKVSKATMFIKKGPEKAFQEVLSSKNPATEMQKLVALSKKDPTGEALKGLKSSFMDHAIKNASESALDLGGLPYISGIKLKNFFNNNSTQKSAKRLFADDPSALKRIKKIINTAVRMDKARRAKPAKEGIIGDVPGMIAQNIAALLGATVGRFSGIAVGSGATLQYPSRFSSAFQKLLGAGVSDPAKRLITDAVNNKELFESILDIKIPKTPKEVTKFKKRLGVWVNAVLLEHGGEFIDAFEESEPSQPQELQEQEQEPQPPRRNPDDKRQFKSIADNGQAL